MDTVNRDGGVPSQLSPEAIPLLKEGITLLLSRWTALQMAVENEWGGRDSRRRFDQIAADIFSWFTQSKEPHYIDDLENMLDESMISLNTMTEDGSIDEVAEKLMIMHEECLEGNYKSIESLREANSRTEAVPKIRQIINDNDDDDDESFGDDGSAEMIVDAPESLSNLKPIDMMVDESRPTDAAEADDGWTVVAPRRNKGRRN